MVLPHDVRNLGARCCQCGSQKTVYNVAVPPPGWTQGLYCLKCLLQSRGATGIIPTPMPTDLMDWIDQARGILQARSMIVVPDMASALLRAPPG